MAIGVHLHRLLVLRVVEGTGAFVTVENFHHVRRKRRAELQLLRRPLLHARERRTEDQTDDPLGTCEHVLEREHPAPGRAEEMDPVEPQLRAHRDDLFTKDVHRPLEIVRAIRAAAANLVVDHDRPLRRKPVEGTEVVMRGTRPTV